MHDLSFYTKFEKILDVRNNLKTSENTSLETYKFFKVLNYCLRSLKDEYRMILTKTYFERSYQFWWLDYYCKSSFYRKRYWAIVGFVCLFEMIYENFNDSSSYFN